jgi:hypothetical protein
MEPLTASEKLINDMYQDLIQNEPAEGTKILELAKKTVENKDYCDEFWFDMNVKEDCKKNFIRELKEMMKNVKKYWCDFHSANPSS